MRKFFKVLAFVLFFLALGLFLCSSKLAYLPVYSKTVTLKQYNGRSMDVNLSQPKRFLENYPFSSKAITIHSKFILAPGDINHPYINLFQTDSYNNGIRYEFQSLPDGTYTSGIVIKNDKSPEKFFGISMGNPPVHLMPNKQYSFDMEIDRDGLLAYHLSQITSTDQEAEIVSGTIQENLNNYAIKDIVVGAGFDNSRTFSGIIENFQMKYQELVPGFTQDTVNTWAIELLLIAIGLFVLADNGKSCISIARIMKRLFVAIRAYAIIISSILILLAIGIFSFAEELEYFPVYSKTVTLKQYNSRSMDANLSQPKRFLENYPFSSKAITIHSKFILAPGDINHPYLNLFQTDSYNNGIRYEFQSMPDGTYVSSIVIKNDKSPEKFFGISMGNPPVHLMPNKQYSFDMKIDRDGLLAYHLSQITSTGQEAEIVSGNIQENLNNYAIKDIVVGAGFDNSRKFSGIIDNFQMKYQDLVPGFARDTVNTWAIELILIAIGLLVLADGGKSCVSIAKIIKRLLVAIRAYAIIISSILILLAIGIFSFTVELEYFPVFSKTVDLKQFYGSSLDPKLSQPKQVNEDYQFSVRSVEISGDFLLPPVNVKTPSYMDLFQTDSYNRGVRFELQAQPDGVYTAGLAIKSDKVPEGVVAFTIGNPPERLVPNHPYKITVKINSSGLLQYRWFDYSSKKEFSSEAQVDADGYSIREVSIGSGFDNSRKFMGKIGNFQIKYKGYTHLLSVNMLNLLGIVLLLIAWVVSAFGRNNQKNNQHSTADLATYYIAASLICIYPLLQLYSVNVLNVGVGEIVKFSGELLGIAFLLLSMFYCIYKSFRKALLFLVICTGYLFFTGKVYESISFLISSDVFVFICLLSLLAFHIAIQLIDVGDVFIKYVKRIIYLLFSMSILSVLFYTIKPAITAKYIRHVDSRTVATQYRPDIYFIISDMHVSQLSSIKHLGYDKQAFISKLKSVGFFVANNAASNYAYTEVSIPSMLNLSYLTSEVNNHNKIMSYYNYNQMALDLKKMGYKYIFVSPRRYIIEKSDIADVNMTCSKISDFEGILWQYSLFFRTNKLGDVYRNGVMCGFEEIKESVLMPGPKFVFAHLISPHPPYVFNKDGTPVPLDKQDDLQVSLTKVQLNKQGYLGQMQFISKKLIEIVDFILAHSKEPPIIIIQGDHGFSLYTDSEISSGKILPPEDNINARMRVLAAYYFPKGGENMLYDTISPINMTRGLMRYYFGRKDLERVADVSYWSAETDMFHFVDVTDKIRAQDEMTTKTTSFL